MAFRAEHVTPELLLEHANWMHALARRLVGDAQRAEELSQETWVRALEHPPEGNRPLRGWLATVMRNVLRQELRTSARRDVRETQRALDAEDASEDATTLAEKLSSHQVLVEAVQGLDEPYRSTILLRYFEELTPRRIAARSGVPVATVKTRLARALERLRRDLDRRHGDDGHTWLTALLPLVQSPPAVAAPTDSSPPPAHAPLLPSFPAGAFVMQTKILATVAGVALAGLSLAYVFSKTPATHGDSAGASQATSPAVHTASSKSTEPASQPSAAQAETIDEAARVAVGVEESAAPSEAPTGSVAGRVIDTDGRAVQGVEVQLLSAVPRQPGCGVEPPSASPRAETDASGAFRFETASARAFVVSTPRWTTLLGGEAIHGEGESVVVVAPPVRFSGQVVDESGVPVPEARIELVPPANLRARLGPILDFSFPVAFQLVSDEAGRFSCALFPALAEGRLEVRAKGFAALDEPSPTADESARVLVLRRPDAAGRTLSGVVLDPAGKPVPAAHVSLGVDTRATDSDGRFVFELDDPESFNRQTAEFLDVRADRLLAVKRGFLPGELSASGVDLDGNPTWPPDVTLRLGAEPLALEGRIEDEDGQPLAGIRVFVADPSFFGGFDDGGRMPRLALIEPQLGGSDPDWPRTESDSRGRFRIEGLLDRSYTVAALDPTTLLRIEEPARAGRTDVRIVLPAEASYETLRGTIVDSSGQGIEGVSIVPMCDAFVTRVGEVTASTRHMTVEGMVTGEDGRFTLYDVPHDLVYLRMDGPDTIPLEWGRRIEGGLRSLVGEDHDALVITLSRRCHFQVELGADTEADEIGILDGEGQPLVISEFLGGRRRERFRHPLHEGSTNPLAVTDAARTLVLYRADDELRRLPIYLEPGEPQTIRP